MRRLASESFHSAIASPTYMALARQHARVYGVGGAARALAASAAPGGAYLFLCRSCQSQASRRTGFHPLVSHSDAVRSRAASRLDWDARAQAQVLTHLGTQERRELVGTGWDLAWGPDGFAYLVNDTQAEQAETDIDDLFSMRLAKSIGEEARQVVLGGTVQDAGAPRRVVFLDSVTVQFSEHQFAFKVGPTRADHVLDIAIFVRPRSGFRCFFSLTKIYSCLAFDMFKRTPSRWAWQSLPSFTKALSTFVEGQVERSQSYDENDTMTELARRCLPFHAVSSVGVVMLLLQWSTCSSRHGGLKQPRHQVASRSLLKTIVSNVCSGRSLAAPILVDDGWRWQWPRPPAGEHPVDLLIQDLCVGRRAQRCLSSAVLVAIHSELQGCRA